MEQKQSQYAYCVELIKQQHGLLVKRGMHVEALGKEGYITGVARSGGLYVRVRFDGDDQPSIIHPGEIKVLNWDFGYEVCYWKKFGADHGWSTRYGVLGEYFKSFKAARQEVRYSTSHFRKPEHRMEHWFIRRFAVDGNGFCLEHPKNCILSMSHGCPPCGSGVD